MSGFRGQFRRPPLEPTKEFLRVSSDDPGGEWLNLPDSTRLDGSPATFAAKLLAREPALDWSFRTAFIIVSWLRWIPNLVVAELMVRQRRLAAEFISRPKCLPIVGARKICV